MTRERFRCFCCECSWGKWLLRPRVHWSKCKARLSSSSRSWESPFAPTRERERWSAYTPRGLSGVGLQGGCRALGRCHGTAWIPLVRRKLMNWKYPLRCAAYICSCFLHQTVSKPCQYFKPKWGGSETIKDADLIARNWWKNVLTDPKTYHPCQHFWESLWEFIKYIQCMWFSTSPHAL